MSGGVTDPTITPFVRGMMAAGWDVQKQAGSRCDKLGRCERCQNPYLFTFLRGEASVDGCPFCDELGKIAA